MLSAGLERLAGELAAACGERGVEALAEAYPGLLGEARSRRGAFYTPSDVVRLLVDEAIGRGTGQEGDGGGDAGSGLRVLDPACGTGHFLIDVVRRWPGAEVVGVEIDPAAAMICRARLEAVRAGAGSGIVVADALSAGGVARVLELGFVDAVVGNPPFLNQLERATAQRPRERAAWCEALGLEAGVLGPYADAAAAFLVLGMRLVRDGGRVGMVLPQSMLAARDAGGVRRMVRAWGKVVSVWVGDGSEFDAAVRACALVIERGARGSGAVARFAGPDASASGAIGGEVFAGETWAGVLVGDGPRVRVAGDAIETLALVTAGFRDEYYAAASLVREAAEVAAAQRCRVVTAGAIDLAACCWGERSMRIAKRAWDQPCVDAGELAACGMRGARWLVERLRPKVLVATQTRVLEAVVDEEGYMLPMTPVLSIEPQDGEDLWRLAAAMASPIVTALAVERYAGAALSASAIKVSARQLRAMPLPRDRRAWDEGARLFERAQRDAGEREATLGEMGRVMARAYGLDRREAEEVCAWWDGRRLRNPNAAARTAAAALR